MTPELQERIFATAPTLYQRRKLSPQATSMCWGIDAGDGWFDIIMDLSQTLEPYATGDGVRAEQVKEKYGVLHFYVNNYMEPVEALIDAAEDASSRTCEDCGNPGTLRTGGWMRTLCDDCEGTP